MFDLPPPRHISTLRNLAIGAGIDEGSQSTRKLSYPEIKTFGTFACLLPVKGLGLP
jgi:hypothetical protein